MKWVVLQLALLVAVCLSTAGLARAETPTTPPTIGTTPGMQIIASASPQALPNDGHSEAQIQVRLLAEGQPLAGQQVKASVESGGGLVFTPVATTDSSGVATFQFRAGIMPEDALVNFSVNHDAVEPPAKVEASLAIPIAPLTFLDLELIKPEDYSAMLARQVAAAPIYKLKVTGFPDQLAADGGSLSALTAQLTTVDGKAAAGVPLSIELVSGDGKLIVDKQATDLEGQLPFHFCAGYLPGTATIRVTELSTGLIAEINIVVVKAGPARIELYYLSPLARGMQREGALLPADGFTGMPLVAKVTNLMGLPLPGANVKLELVDNGSGWLEVLDPVSDAQGLVNFTYYAGSTPGKVRLRAFVTNTLDIGAPNVFGPLGI